MIALIDQYRKELLKVNGFAASTVDTYTISIKAFCGFAKNELEMDPVKVKGPQLLKWILHLKNGASDILVGTPSMLWFASRKPMDKTIIPKPEVGNGHPLAVGLFSRQHGLKAGVKAEVRSTSPEGLGLDIRFGYAIVFKGKRV